MKALFLVLAGLAISPVLAAEETPRPTEWQGVAPWPAANDPTGAKSPVQWQSETRSRIELVGEQDIPANAFGDMVRKGREIFLDTPTHARAYAGNSLSCGNCHLGGGRKPHSAPLWAALPLYPGFEKKSGKVVTLAERIQQCFAYSLNGTPPPADSPEMTALVAYSHWLATGLPTGVEQPGRNYPRLKPPAQAYDPTRGQAVYLSQCALCHGDDGQGLAQDGQQIFPPLWGKRAYSWASDMQRVDVLAGFIQANMPLGKPNSLSEQDAWDAAAYINSQERPQDPRFIGSVEETAARFHQDEMSFYGKQVNGAILGQGAGN